MPLPIAIHWFRRDLRWHDNTALWQALQGEHPVVPLFIFDTDILNQLENRYDRRVDFIHRQVMRLNADLNARGRTMLVEYGKPVEVWRRLIATHSIAAVYTNRDYEPYAQQRDREVYELLQAQGIAFKGAKDHVIFEKDEVTKADGLPYTVYTPYSRRWLERYAQYPPTIAGNALDNPNFCTVTPFSPCPSLADIGFMPTDTDFKPPLLDTNTVKDYHEQRDSVDNESGTTQLSVHFRFGTVSIREMAQIGAQLNPAWLNELIWRDFYHAILYHFPHVVKRSFKAQYDRIVWRNDESEFKHWCEGTTGYPIVDAGMRQLNQTGFMHNRVRMITASFLVKHLLIDWQWGEAYFAQQLLDFDLAANNGGWQWAAGSGCDAAPYFRVFNPTTQVEKFDKKHRYIHRWVPEYGTDRYPKPMVEHAIARERALQTYKRYLSNDAS